MEIVVLLGVFLLLLLIGVPVAFCLRSLVTGNTVISRYTHYRSVPEDGGGY